MNPIRLDDGDIVMNYFVIDPLTGERVLRRFICRCGANAQGVFLLCHCASPNPVE